MASDREASLKIAALWPPTDQSQYFGVKNPLRERCPNHRHTRDPMDEEVTINGQDLELYSALFR